ncbi:MAG TPA: hypothetical protein VFQ88_16460, partial [Nevskiaceae bacterium]|nr:hypothetical protein [Nevskiaceae bacterium]
MATAIGKSQPTISRLLAGAGNTVARWGHARRTRYASTRDVRGLGTRWPLYQIDTHGQAHSFGQLVALHGDACLIRAEHLPEWFRGEFVDG